MPPVTREIMTLKAALGEFVRHPTPQLLSAQVAVLLAVRLVLGPFHLSDAIVIVALIGAQPFVEWLIHVYVLHCPANGSRRDKLAGYSHRRHHEDPRDLRFQFVHPYTVYGGWVLLAVIVLAFRNPTSVTGAMFASVLTMTYEWIHFLIHTDYAPQHGPYRRLHRAHRLHHFRNERYWLGVTRRFGDKVLGTNPAKQDVEISPTAKTALASRS